ncbi:MAG: Acetolactate synthase large subunit IlvG, partial [Pseudomonadota bacterium]
LLAQSDADALMKRLSEARRPLILAGPACLSRSGRVKMLALESASGVPVIGMESPRGTADASLGAFAQVLAQSDCIVLLNKRLDFTLRFGQAPVFPAAASLHQIDPDTREIERTRAHEKIGRCAAPHWHSGGSFGGPAGAHSSCSIPHQPGLAGPSQGGIGLSPA